MMMTTLVTMQQEYTLPTCGVVVLDSWGNSNSQSQEDTYNAQRATIASIEQTTSIHLIHLVNIVPKLRAHFRVDLLNLWKNNKT